MSADNRLIKYAPFYLRLALGTAYLSSVASRLQIWPKGLGGSGWGTFLEYTAEVNPWAPASLVPLLGWSATVAEATLGLMLVLGLKQRLTGILSGILLLIFAASMMVGTGVKSPFDYSVFTASAASFAFAIFGESAWSLDAFIERFIKKTPVSEMSKISIAGKAEKA